jgi:hypothetical protein
MSAKPAYSMDADLIESIDWDALTPWTQNQLVGLLEFCQQHGWTPRHIGESLSRTLEPLVSVWQMTFETHQKLKTVWIINGDLPIDYIPYNNIPTARDALLHFSRKFLSRAQAMKRQADTQSETEFLEKDKQLMQRLVKAAADLLVLYHEDEVWTD